MKRLQQRSLDELQHIQRHYQNLYRSGSLQTNAASVVRYHIHKLWQLMEKQYR